MRRTRALALCALAGLVVLVALAAWFAWRHVRAAKLDSALVAAAERGDAGRIPRLLANGANPNARQVMPVPVDVRHLPELLLGTRRSTGWTALMLAVWSGRVGAAQQLIAAGADVNARTGAGGTALMCAAAAGNTKMARLLIDCGADVEARASTGQRALDFVPTGYPELRRLLRPGAIPGGREPRGTPMSMP